MALTVKQLREELEGLPDDMPVIIQKDSEGNDYSPAAGASGGNVSYIPETTWRGKSCPTELTHELRTFGYTEEDTAQGEGVPCFLVWPIS